MAGRGDALRVVRPEDVVDWQVPRAAWPHHHSAPSGVAALDVYPPWLATAHGDGSLRVRRLDDGSTVTEQRWQSGVLKDVAFSRDGSTLAVIAAEEAAVNLVGTDTWGRHPVAVPQRSRRVAWLDADRLMAAPYGAQLVTWRREGSSGLTELPAWVPAQVEDAHPDLDPSVAGPGAVTLTHAGRVVWLPADGGVPEEVASVPGARAVACRGEEAAVLEPHAVRFVRRGRPEAQVDLPGAEGVDVALSPDGRFVAVGHLDGTATVLSREPLAVVARLRGHEARVAAVGFTPDSAWLVTASWDGDARVWATAPLLRPAQELEAAVAADWGMNVEDALAR